MAVSATNLGNNSKSLGTAVSETILPLILTAKDSVLKYFYFTFGAFSVLLCETLECLGCLGWLVASGGRTELADSKPPRLSAQWLLLWTTAAYAPEMPDKD
eukprot:644504-Amphidinium_carterae.1